MDEYIMTGEPRLAVALLIVDVQQGLFERQTPIHRAESLMDNIRELAQRARNAGVPVVYIQHANKMLVPGTAPWHLHPGLTSLEGDLHISKTHGNAFEDTDLEEELKARSIGEVVVCGLVTEGCVQATCRGARARGYRVTLVSDAHSTYHRDARARIAELNAAMSEELDAVRPAAQIDFGPLLAG